MNRQDALRMAKGNQKVADAIMFEQATVEEHARDRDLEEAMTRLSEYVDQSSEEIMDEAFLNHTWAKACIDAPACGHIECGFGPGVPGYGSMVGRRALLRRASSQVI